jgi:hypothetical protein
MSEGDGMRVKCLWCGGILESITKHNMIWCKCGKTGLDYHPIWARIAFNRKGDSDMFEVMK